MGSFTVKLSFEFVEKRCSVKSSSDILKSSSFYSFVNFYRVEKSKVLLKLIPDTYVIESIIEESGFNSRSTFFRVFKEFTGETPGHFLQNNKA